MPQIPISVDLSELQAEFNLMQLQVEELGSIIVDAVTDRIFHNWQTAAMNGLHKTRKAYINALNIGIVSSTHKYIQLTGELPNMIEEGVGAFDMKAGMLNSQSAKIGKNGVRFITIPFRWATPSAIGESEVMASKMPVEIYNLVRRLRPTVTALNTNKNIQSGGSLGFSKIPSQYRIPLSRPGFSDIKTRTTYPEYTHQGPIFEGMIRNQKQYENATQGSYFTFRRISENSDPMSWIHKGIAAKNFAEHAIKETNVSTITDRTVDTYLLAIVY